MTRKFTDKELEKLPERQRKWILRNRMILEKDREYANKLRLEIYLRNCIIGENMKTKKTVKYYGVSLPLPFVKKINEHIKNDVNYRNVPQFVKDAVKEKIERDEDKIWREKMESNIISILKNVDNMKNLEAKKK